MRIDNIELEYMTIGVIFFENYAAPYIESVSRELELVVQTFRPLLDEVDKLERLIVDSNKLRAGNLFENCIGENETIISFKDGYFQFYDSRLGSDIYLELEASIWIELLERLKSFMIRKRGENFTAQF
jgi:hypothetical protein